MSAARILIITNGHLCRNPRPLKEAATLGQAGYEVTVLGVRNHSASEQLDREILRGAPFRHLAVDMIPGFGRDSAATIWRRRVRLWLAREAAIRFGYPTMEALGPAAALLRKARQHAADLTIVHNEVPHWVGTRLLARSQRVAADIEDWHSEDLLPEDRTGRPLARLRTVERTLLSQAVYTSTTSHALASALAARYHAPPPIVLTNSFPLQPDPRTSPAAEPVALFWFSQTLGPGRGLESFCDAWIQTKHPSRLVLLGQPCPGFVDALLSRLPTQLAPRARFLPLVSPAELPSLIARHDIGLALEQSWIVNRDLTITNKILQYLNAGLAVVATPTTGQREVFSRAPGAGILVDLAAPAATAAALDSLIGDRAKLASAQRAARAAAEQTYCWEREAPHLLAAVATALHRPRL